MLTARRRQFSRVGAGVGFGLALACLPVLVGAQAVPASAGSAPAELAPWIVRMQQAASVRSYQGTLAFTVGGTVSSARLQHFGDGRESYERLEVLDGRARVQYRHNEQVLTVWPATKLAVFEPRDPVAAFPAMADSPGLRPQQHYELRKVGSDRVAGREADVLLVTPRDALRFAQRWWADRDTGLMLRGDTLGTQGEVLESAAFTDLQLLGKPQPDAVLGPMRRLEGLRVLRPQPAKTLLDAEGWQLTRPVAGFQQISCHRRALDAGGDGPPVQVLQSVYSDGLAHVSVFIEPYDAGRHKQGMRTTMGATNTVMHRRGDWWITVVGEVPMATVLQFDALLERRR